MENEFPKKAMEIRKSPNPFWKKADLGKRQTPATCKTPRLGREHWMETYYISFVGREKDAIGTYTNYHFLITARDEAHAFSRLYEKYQDIVRLWVLNKICAPEGTPTFD